MVSAAARLDWAKLNHLNNHYIREADPVRLAALVATILKGRDFHLRQGDETLIAGVIPFVRDGVKTTLELADAVIFSLKSRPLELPSKALEQLTDETRARLTRLRLALAQVTDWSVPGLEVAVRAFAEADGVGIGKFGAPLRSVLSGGSPAPDLAGTMTALGRDESLGRIDDALSLPA